MTQADTMQTTAESAMRAVQSIQPLLQMYNFLAEQLRASKEGTLDVATLPDVSMCLVDMAAESSHDFGYTNIPLSKMSPEYAPYVLSGLFSAVVNSLLAASQDAEKGCHQFSEHLKEWLAKQKTAASG